MKILFIISLFVSLNSFGQDTTTHEFVVVPQGFINKYAGKLKHFYLGSEREFNYGWWNGKAVTSSNSFKDFPEQMKEVPPAFQFVRLKPIEVLAGKTTQTR